MNGGGRERERERETIGGKVDGDDETVQCSGQVLRG